MFLIALKNLELASTHQVCESIGVGLLCVELFPDIVVATDVLAGNILHTVYELHLFSKTVCIKAILMGSSESNSLLFSYSMSFATALDGASSMHISIPGW